MLRWQFCFMQNLRDHNANLRFANHESFTFKSRKTKVFQIMKAQPSNHL